MEIIPAINCFDLSCVKERLLKAKSFGARMAHFDVSDGVFASVRSWNDPQTLKKAAEAEGVFFEVHFMVEKPAGYLKDWFLPFLKRVMFHIETVDREMIKNFVEIMPPEVEMGFSLLPETPVSDVQSFLDEAAVVQILAVRPGKSGQIFMEEALEKIKELRLSGGSVRIEVDGGINLKTAKAAKEAGADILVSASYIWNSIDPAGAYNDLTGI